MVNTKLMRLGFLNRIVIVESNSDSKFDRQFWSDLNFNDNLDRNFDLILIKIDLILIKVGQD